MSQDKQLTDLTELTTPADGDYVYVVDVSDTTDDAAGSSRKVQLANARGWPQTSAESAAGVTPMNLQYEPGNILRYGATGDGTTDNATAIQNAIDAMEAAGGGEVVFPVSAGGKVYAIESRLTVASSTHVQLVGIGGAVEIKWTGSALSTSTNDDETGAMIEFTGTDHAWSGIKNLHLNADVKAVHCIYFVGTTNNGFKLEDVRLKWPQLDGIYYNVSGSTGPNNLFINNCSSFPQTTIGGNTCSCGRAILHFVLNNAAGKVVVNGGSYDNGGSKSVIYWETNTNAAADLIVNDLKWENWQNGADFIITNHTVDTTVGSIYLNGVKTSQSAASLGDLVANENASIARRMQVFVRGLITNNAFTNIYTDANDSSLDIPYDTDYRWHDFILNATSGMGTFPRNSSFPTTPIPGSYYWDNTNGHLLVHDGTTSYKIQAIRKVSAPGSSPQTVPDDSHGNIYVNHSVGGSLTITLPSLANVKLGHTLTFIATVATNTIAVTPSGSENLNGANSALTSGGSLGDTLTVVAARQGASGTWIVTEREGTWS